MVDAVIIGAGHNGLVASIVLARAGLDVLVLDHVTWPGGGLAGYHVVGGVEVPIGGLRTWPNTQRLNG
ncbi:NAD(P)-binding protein [Vulcanisaeta distributa]|uniref:NAD(P)-binding protein n=1 Tax=Vulcanisaeta distributa TaxID=164451 RepID=UPI000A407A26|nr:NAD(P)-binding protein [Vulcanisaeta distributa]